MNAVKDNEPMPSLFTGEEQPIPAFSPTDDAIQPVKSIKIVGRAIYHIEDGRLYEAKPGAIIPVRGASRSIAAMFDQTTPFEVIPQEAFQLLMSGLAVVMEYDRDTL